MATAEAPRASTASSEPPLAEDLAPVPAPRAGTGRFRHATPALYLLPATTLYGLFVLWPLLHVLWLSLQRWDGYGPQTFIGLQNFGDLFGDPVFRTTLAHSLEWFAAAVALTALGLALALLVHGSLGRRSATLPLAVLFFPALLPATVVAGVWTLVYTPLSGLLNTFLRAAGVGSLTRDWLGDPHLALPALIVAWAWSATGIGTLILWSGLGTIRKEYIDLALIEGAGRKWRFRHVLWPGLRRSAVVALLLNVALAEAVFDLVYVTTGGGPGYATVILPIDMYGRAFGGHTGQGAAVAVIQIALGLIPAAVALLLLRGNEETTGGEEDPAPAGAPRARRAPSLRGLGGRGNPSSRSAILALLGLALVAMLLPLGWLAVVALGGGGFTIGSHVDLSPASWTWGSFSSVWNSGFAGAMETSVLLALAVVALTIALAAPAAFALGRLAALLRAVALVLLLAGFFQPTPVLIIPLFDVLRGLSLLDTPWGIVLPETARILPFAILLLWAFLSQLPREVVQAAEVDGASPLQLMVRVALPLARPALFAVSIWAFITSWNEYLLPTLVSQDGSLQTIPTLLGSLIGRYNTQYSLLAAGSLIAIAPALLVYVLLRRPAATGLSRAERSVQ